MNIQSPILRKIYISVKEGNKKILEDFWRDAEEIGLPIIENLDEKHKLVTFIVREEPGVKRYVVASFISGYELEKNILNKLEGTDIYYRTYKVENGVRDNYFIGKDIPLDFEEVYDNWDKYKNNCILDPYNDKKFIYPGNEEYGAKEDITSVVELPDAVEQPWVKIHNNVPKGNTEVISFKSSILGNERKVWIYTPHDYNKDIKPYNLLLTFDGYTYTQAIPTPTILDNMIFSGKIPSTIGVFVGNASTEARFKELMCDEDFAKFIAEELIPYIRNNYNVTDKPSESVIAGSSSGGLTSTFIATKYSNIFGNVLSQSGAYWWSFDEPELLTKELMNRDKLPLNFYCDVGKLEHFEGMVTTNRNFKDMLEKKGYNYYYNEFMGGHQPLCWQGTLSDGLLKLVGKKD